MITNIFIGFDTNNLGQRIAFEVCKRSIQKYNKYVNVTGIYLSHLIKDGIYKRPHDPKQSTEFTYTRFLVPYLSNYTGYSVFCDSDFLFQCDIQELDSYIDSKKSVSCVKHQYTECNNTTKMDGKPQERYPRKNWSSLMVFNCNHPDCKTLTPDIINKQTPKFLHRLEWTTDNITGSIPLEYNYLVGYYKNITKPKAIHFTDGGPWHQNYTNVEYANLWLEYLTEKERKQYKNGDFWKK